MEPSRSLRWTECSESCEGGTQSRLSVPPELGSLNQAQWLSERRVSSKRPDVASSCLCFKQHEKAVCNGTKLNILCSFLLVWFIIFRISLAAPISGYTRYLVNSYPLKSSAIAFGPLVASALQWRSGSEVASQLYIPWKLLSGVEWTLLQSMEGRHKPGISCIQILLVNLLKALQGLKMTVIWQKGSCRAVTYCNTTSITLCVNM